MEKTTNYDNIAPIKRLIYSLNYLALMAYYPLLLSRIYAAAHAVGGRRVKSTLKTDHPGLLVLNLGSYVRLRSDRTNHVWSCDFVMAATSDGKPIRLENVIYEYTGECLAIQVARSFKIRDVEACLTELFCGRGVPEQIRSDKGSEFTTKFIENGGITDHFLQCFQTAGQHACMRRPS